MFRKFRHVLATSPFPNLVSTVVGVYVRWLPKNLMPTLLLIT